MKKLILLPALTLALLLPHAAIGQADAKSAAEGLSSPDPNVRAKAACDLREMGDEASAFIPQLAGLLDDGSPVDPAICGDRQWRFGRNGETTSPGEQAASALVGVGSRAYDAVVAALKGSAWIARKNAAWALGALDDRRAGPLLTTALHDTESAVRANSAWALGALDESVAVPALIEALEDSDASVRRQVAWALGAIGDRRAVDGLVHALEDADAGVRSQAAWALGAIGDNRAVLALTKLLKDSDVRVRRQAAWALGAIGG